MREEQKKIYFASGETVEKIALLPQVESVIAHGYYIAESTVKQTVLRVVQKTGVKDRSEFASIL